MKIAPSSIDLSESSSSLIARVGQVMAVIITLGLVSMISSMLVTESLNGDAAQINKAGALRMQAVRISRAYFVDQSPTKEQVRKEIHTFNLHLTSLFHGKQLTDEQDTIVGKQYEKILSLWQQVNSKSMSTKQLSEEQLAELVHSYDRFVDKLDELVDLLQLESEKKLSFLRLIQGITLLLVIAVASFVLIKLNRILIVPLKQLVNVAEQAGKGNFELKASYNKNDELGVLAQTINQMSDELKLTYQEFEQRVDNKTQQLSRTNQSLDVLYRAARNLAGYTLSEQDSASYQIDHQIIDELVQVLGFGKIKIEVNDSKQNNLIIDVYVNNIIDNICFNYHKFPLEKQNRLFGYLIWEIPKGKQVHDWQQQILQAMADIIATAIELDQKRTSENRLVIVEERAVIARELHDSLAQSLSYLKVQMSLLTRKMQKNLPQAQVEETIEDIKEGLNSAYLQLRELLTTFRLKLDDPAIKNSLQSTVTEFSAKCQYNIEFTYQLPQNYLSANQEIHLLQIVREALSNIHRHANASKAGISILLDDDKVKVQIWDNGAGLSESHNEQGHLGIGIMQERAKSLNAALYVEARAEQGTLVRFEFNH
ncbi:MAG: histidine kinase [Colwellia sp.]|nr:histidine kinase [Colwellia sp.]MCW8865935.1 histidine kinase [Colwellia sp.]MCW9081827.1 histidine kinase [Colwellia sp.]